MVESSLSENTLLAWQRSSFCGRDGSKEDPPKSELDFLMVFLKQEIEHETQRKLAREGFGDKKTENKRIQRQTEVRNNDNFPTAAGLFSGSNGKSQSIKFYGVNSMHSEQRDAFLKWHAAKVNEDYVFKMKEGIVDYCVSDVDILRRACVKFRQTFIKDCGVCPFTEAVIIASAWNKVCRRRFLKHRTIGLIPENGYRMNSNQSKVALEWLIWEEETRLIRIEQAARGREAVLDGNLKVDGYYDTEKLVFEFHGCFYYGHDLCFPQETLNSRFDRTVAKTNKLRELGYTNYAYEVFPCQW
ncbi:hypothetical protein CBL_20104 [Carabus blaptoides fortunei]